MKATHVPGSDALQIGREDGSSQVGDVERAGSWRRIPVTAGMVILSLFAGIPGVFAVFLTLLFLAIAGLSTGGGFFVLRALIPDTYGGNLGPIVINGPLLCVLPIITVVIANWARSRESLGKTDSVLFMLLGWVFLVVFLETAHLQGIDRFSDSFRFGIKFLLGLVNSAIPLVLLPYLYGRMAVNSEAGRTTLRRGALIGLFVLFALAFYEFVLQHPIGEWLPTGGGLSYQAPAATVFTFGRYRVGGAFGNGLYVGVLACLFQAIFLFVPRSTPLPFRYGLAVSLLALVVALFFGISRTGSIGVILVASSWLLSRTLKRPRLAILLLLLVIPAWLLYGPYLTDFVLTGGTGWRYYLYATTNDVNFMSRLDIYAALLTRSVPLLALTSSRFVEAVRLAPQHDLASGWLVLLYSYGLLPVLFLLSMLVLLSGKVVHAFSQRLDWALGLLVLIWIAPLMWLSVSERMVDPMFCICFGICHQSYRNHVARSQTGTVSSLAQSGGNEPVRYSRGLVR